MKEAIKKNLDNPHELEKMYRADQSGFKNEFNLMFSDVHDNVIARAWHERLNFENKMISPNAKSELPFVIFASVLAGCIAKIPTLFSLNSELFFTRNIAFIIFPFLTAYFARRKNLPQKSVVTISVVMLLSLGYINFFPGTSNSDTWLLVCIHLPLLLWAALGYAFTSGEWKRSQKLMGFLRYNGDLIVMTTLILLAGALLTVLSISLFSLIHIDIKEVYFNYIGIWGLAASPLVATWLIRSNPQLVNRISPVIAKVFTPLVFLTLLAYLCAIAYTGMDPFKDREFLLIFNLLLIAVIAIIFFSIAEVREDHGKNFQTLMLLGLSILTIIINGIALSAILYRISEWGLTPNRIAVLGGNLIMLIHLILIGISLIKIAFRNASFESIENTIGSFIPFYLIWALVVTFLLPLVFNYR